MSFTRFPFQCGNLTRVSDPYHFKPANPDLLDTDLLRNFNINQENLSSILIIGFRNYRDNSIKTRQKNKKSNFCNLTDPKAGRTIFLYKLEE